MSFDPIEFKNQFPLFRQPQNRDLVYLDNAATSQRPQVVIDAVSDFYLNSNANTHRSSHRLARQATELVEQTRAKAARFINAVSSDEIVFTCGTTEALNLLANSLTVSLQPGDEIVLTTAEHHANLVPWQMAAQRHNLVLKFVPYRDGRPDLSSLRQVLSGRTRIVTTTAASNALGFVADLSSVKKQLVDHNLVWVVDAAQLVAHHELDVQALGCDFLACSAHKFYGPTGIGLLYGRTEQLASLPPWQGGGEMIRHVDLQNSQYSEPPHRFETGTSSLAAIAGLNACFDFWQSLDRPAMARHEQELVEYLHQRLQGVSEISLLSTTENNIGIATFTTNNQAKMGAADLAHWLDSHDIAVRVGHHCAMPLMASHTKGASVRVSLAAYNCKQDVDRVIAVLQAALKGEVDSREVAELSLDALQKLRGWQPRYRQILKWGDAIQAKPDIRGPENLVIGCESEAWLKHSLEQGRHRYQIDSDARVVRGLAALLLRLIDNKTSNEIRAVDLTAVFSELGLERHLSPSRSNGFKALVERALSFV